MADILDIDDAVALPIATPLTARPQLSRAVISPKADAIPRRPALWTTGNDRVDGPHESGTFAVPPVQAFFLRDALVGGKGAHVRLAWQDRTPYIAARGVVPAYVRNYMAGDVRVPAWSFDPSLPTRRFGALFTILDFHLAFGHFLVEMFPKLFTIQRLNNAGIRAPLAWPSTAPAYALQMIRAAARDLPIEIYDPARETLSADLLIMPGSMETDYVYHPQFATDLRTYTRYVRPAIRAERLFVSRAAMQGPGGFRKIENEAEIEQIAVDRGFTLIQPEFLPHRLQAAAFASARVVVGEYGSGLLNTMFSPPGTRVVALNRVDTVLSNLANTLEHDVGYVLAEDGQLRFYGCSAPVHYRINPAEFARRLDQVVGKSA